MTPLHYEWKIIWFLSLTYIKNSILSYSFMFISLASLSLQYYLSNKIKNKYIFVFPLSFGFIFKTVCCALFYPNV